MGEVRARDAVLDAEDDQRPRVIEHSIFEATVSVASSSASKASSPSRSAVVISCVDASVADEPFDGDSSAPGCVSACTCFSLWMLTLQRHPDPKIEAPPSCSHLRAHTIESR